MAFGDSYSEAKHDDGRVMKLTRSNSNGLTRMRAVVFSQKRPGNIRRKLLSEHNFFEPNEFDAWLAHMEELGWKFPRNLLDPLGSGNGGGWGECRLSPCVVGRTGRHNERT